MPDKAIDLIDEAAARLRTEIDSLPVALDEVSRKVLQLEIEREALRKETDAASRARLPRWTKSIADKRREMEALKTHWEAEKFGRPIARIRQHILKRPNWPSSGRERNYDLIAWRNCATANLPRLERELRRRRTDSSKSKAKAGLLKEEVDEEDIALVVSRWTGIPVTRLLESELQKLLRWKIYRTSGSSDRMKR